MATPKKGMKTTTAPAPTAMTKKPVATPKIMIGVARSTPAVAPRKAVGISKTPIAGVGTPRPGEAKARAVATPVTQRVKSRMLQNEMTKLGILAGKKK